MTKRAAVLAITLILACNGPGPAEAGSILFSFKGTGSGDVERAGGDTLFNQSPFSIEVFANTGAVMEPLPGVFAAAGSAALIDIAGIGAGDLDAKTVFDNQNKQVLGLNGGNYYDLLDVQNSGFATYDLKSSFGPVSDSNPHAFLQFDGEPSSLGLITFSDMKNVTFQAIVSAAVPEPGTLTLFGIGTLLVLGTGYVSRVCSRRAGTRRRCSDAR
jgi:hypothetical protein